MKIAIAGTGYVGLSNAILLSQHHKVTAVDVIQEKVDMVNRKESLIVDDYIEDYLAHKDLDLTATMDGDSAYRDADLIVIAAPTNYDTETNHFDTSAVEAILSQIQRVGSKAIVVIKSTIPIGYTQEISAVYPDLSILFAPEFLREGKALYDNLYPCKGKTEDPEIECRYPDYDGDSDPAYFTIFIDGSPRYVDYPYSAA